jgi:hypothetical protein
VSLAHTPAPWRIVEHPTCFTVRGANGASVAALAFGYRPELLRSEKLANAQITAAAPELYEALVRFSEARNAYLESDYGSASERIAAGKLDEAHELADRVIAKARGEVTHTPIGDER